VEVTREGSVVGKKSLFNFIARFEVLAVEGRTKKGGGGTSEEGRSLI